MKRFFLCIILTFMYVGTYASTWNVVEVKNTEKTATVGYIYHTSAIGTKFGLNKEKVATDFRFVCSAKEFLAGPSTAPIMAIFWDGGPHGTTFQQVEVKIDGKEIQMTQPPWIQEGTLLYRKLSDSKSFIQSLRTGKLVSFSWVGTDNIRRTTMFDLQDFTLNFNSFSANCEI